MTDTKSDVDIQYSNRMRQLQFRQPLYRARNIFRQRRFQAFALGTSKSGSHSMQGLFASRFRSQHEPTSKLINKLIIDWQQEDVSQHEIRRFYRMRDHAMHLELESNSFNTFFCETLLHIFPDAKFILMYREPVAWLNSWINHTINRPERKGSIWQSGLDALYRPGDFNFGEEENLFQLHNLFPLESYLSYWSRCVERIIDVIPTNRLLILPTTKISSSSKALASFLGVRREELDLNRSHLFTAKNDHNIVTKIESGYLAEQVNRICQPIEKRVGQTILNSP